MNRPSVFKMAICFALLGVCIFGALILDDALLPQRSSQANANASGTAAKDLGSVEGGTMGSDSSQTVLELLNGDEIATEELIERCFAISIDTDIPDAFRAEVLDSQDFDRAFTSEGVIVLIHSDVLEKTRSYCRSILGNKSWRILDERIEPEQVDTQMTESYFKQNGLYRWVTLQYFPHGDKTAVIVNSLDLDR